MEDYSDDISKCEINESNLLNRDVNIGDVYSQLSMYSQGKNTNMLYMIQQGILSMRSQIATMQEMINKLQKSIDQIQQTHQNTNIIHNINTDINVDQNETTVNTVNVNVAMTVGEAFEKLCIEELLNKQGEKNFKMSNNIIVDQQKTKTSSYSNVLIEVTNFINNSFVNGTLNNNVNTIYAEILKHQQNNAGKSITASKYLKFIADFVKKNKLE